MIVPFPKEGVIVSAGRKALVTLLVLIGLVAIAVGVVYFVVKGGSLPSFIPGHKAGSGAHHDKRGVIAVVVGVVLLVIAVIGASAGRRR